MRDEPQLTEAHKETLRGQVIDADHPGTVLRDFQALLDFVGAEGLKVGAKSSLFPMEKIDEMNQRLSRPLQLTLKRPQLRSHPYLQGLHLLLRASGLSRVEGTGAKTKLVLDLPVLEQWHCLNATERYFTLLEAWLLNGRPEMVGEPGSWSSDSLSSCLQAWRFLPPKGRQVDPERPNRHYRFGLGRNLYHLALMDLFGLLQVDHPRKPVARWCPATVQHAPFGDALLTLISERFWSSWDVDSPDEEDEDAEAEEEPSATVRFGRLQALFQPYFPAWQNNLVLPQAEFVQGTFVFRVSLGKEVWRTIAIEAGDSLDTLVSWILKAFRFDDDHLYALTYRDRFGKQTEANHPAMDEGPWADEIRVGDVPLKPGQTMSLVYDFGDSWKFDVKLERIEPPNARPKAPRILEKHGKAPRQYPNWDE